ncbi:transmembrane protein 131-like [Scleropages formosus]|nr:transmembrane protein 131-like [Scleropages formosus]
MASTLALLLLFLQSLYVFNSIPLIHGKHRLVQFDPPVLDFQEQPVRIPKMTKVNLYNPSSEDTITLISVSSATAHFYTSFFENNIIPPGGNSSFNVVFHAQTVGNIENTLFIKTSHHEPLTYQVFGVSVPDLYRLRPFTGCRGHENCDFSLPGNTYSEPLRAVEVFSKTGDLQLELPTGQIGSIGKLWEIPISEMKRVTKASLSSLVTENNRTVIRIKTRASRDGNFIILPVKMEVTSVPSVYSSTEKLDFGTLRSQDHPKQLNLYTLNSGTEDVQISSVSPALSNKAIKIKFKPVTVKAGKNTQVAIISFDASKGQRQSQFSGKIVLNVEEKSYSKLEIPYTAQVLKGQLWFDQSSTIFHIRDSPIDPLTRPVFLNNTFSFAIIIHNVSLPEKASNMFHIQNFSQNTLIPSHGSCYLFSLNFKPIRPSIHIDSNILLTTNASKFHLPIRTFTGFLEAFVLPPSLNRQWVDFGVLNTTKTASITLVVLNTNPIEVEVRSWMVSDDSLSVELLRSERGRKTVALSRTKVLGNAPASDQKTIILASGYYAVFRVTLFTQELDGMYLGSIHITTDYEILTIPVKALLRVSKLTVLPKNIVLPTSFPGKIVHQSLSIRNSFSRNVTLQHIHSLTDDVRFYCKRLKNKGDLQPRHKSKIANIYFDASLECGNQCYIGLPFILKSESKPYGLMMQENMWRADADLHQTLLERWRDLKERPGHEFQAVFEMSTDHEKKLHAKVIAQVTWPSIINSPSQILFPLTSIHGSSAEEVVLENPADVSVYVQVLPLALYPNSSYLVEKLVDKMTFIKFPSISTDTLEFYVHRNQTSLNKNTKGFKEGSVAPFVYNLLLLPGEVKSFNVKFTPIRNHSVASLLIIRNNLTVMDYVLVQGQGAAESLMVAGKPPGSSNVLKFRITESLLQHFIQQSKQRQNFTMTKVFNIENDGQIPVIIQSIEISGRICEGYGFKVIDCHEFALTPSTSKDIIIMFTPDFTISQAEAELKLVTAGGIEFLFTLKATLPYHMLAVCTDALPRPSWELGLYVTVCVIMSLMFLVVITTAYLEAQGIWEPFKSLLFLETPNSPMDSERPFVFGENGTNTKLNEYEDANHNSIQETCNPDSSPVRANLQQFNTQYNSNKASIDLAGLRLRINNKIKWSMSRNCRQNQPSQQQLMSTSKGQQAPTIEGTAAVLHRDDPAGILHPESRANPEVRGLHSPEISSPTEAMGEDMEQPKCPSVEVFQNQQLLCMSATSKAAVSKRKIQHKSQAKSNHKEKEQKENAPSITTETSNQDMEANVKEQVVKKKNKQFTVEKEKVETQVTQPKSRKKKADGTKKDSQVDTKTNSLELPYVTALENKQRKNFTAKPLIPSALGPGSNVQTQPVSCGKPEDCPLDPLEKPLSVPDQENSDSSEAESDSNPPPEWDNVPLVKDSNEDFYQLAIQTMNADPFLKQSTDVTCQLPLLTDISCNKVSTISNACIKTSDTKNKLSKSISLPEKSSNPVAVGTDYDGNPGGSALAVGTTHKSSTAGNMTTPYDKSIWAYEPHSAGLWDPVHSSNYLNPLSPLPFSGSCNTFNFSGDIGDMTYHKREEPPPKWPDFGAISPSIWGISSRDTVDPWHTSSGSSTLPIASVFGSGGLWSSATPFTSSIWSPTFTPHTTAAPTSFFGNSNGGCRSAPARSSTPQKETGGTYNPWNSRLPTVNRRSSEPWSNTYNN